MKRSELVFTALLVPVDYVMLLAAAALAYHLRFTTIAGVRPVLYELAFATYFPWAVLAALAWLIVFALVGLYVVRSSRRIVDELAKIVVGCSTGALAIILLVFFRRELFSSRFIIVAGWVLAIVAVSFGRIIVRVIQHALLRRGFGRHHVLVVGQDPTADELVGQIAQRPGLGLTVVARLADGGATALQELPQKFATQRIDEIIVADPTVPHDQTQRLLEAARDHHIVFRYAADLFDARAAHVEVTTLAGIPLIEIKRTPLDGWGKILKRTVDVVLSGLALLILSPVLLLVAVAVKVDSEGPAVVSLARIGERGRPFTLYKFRSMVRNAQELKRNLIALNERADGPLFKIANDPRVTRIGRFIRKTSLDEFPQLWNVLAGHMSLVGPRPHEPEEVAKYEAHHRKLLTVKPGVTGMAQVSGRAGLSFEEEVRLDTFYIEHWSLKLDLQILLRTPAVVLSAKAAG